MTLSDEGRVQVAPVPELETLRGEHMRMWLPVDIAAGADLPLETVEAVAGDRLELALSFEWQDAEEFGLKVRCSPDGLRADPDPGAGDRLGRPARPAPAAPAPGGADRGHQPLQRQPGGGRPRVAALSPGGGRRRQGGVARVRGPQHGRGVRRRRALPGEARLPRQPRGHGGTALRARRRRPAGCGSTPGRCRPIWPLEE